MRHLVVFLPVAEPLIILGWVDVTDQHKIIGVIHREIALGAILVVQQRGVRSRICRLLKTAQVDFPVIGGCPLWPFHRTVGLQRTNAAAHFSFQNGSV